MRIGLEELEGEVISGRYQILRRIGKGGMGVVYLAQQTNLNRNVCIKVLNPALLDDEDAVGRFEREAKGLSRLQHPNIVTIFDYGRDGDLAYIVMEYAQGVTLGKYLKAHGALTLDAFLPVAVQTLKGIGEAHKLGLIHRDIKPANIILAELEGESNFVKILDFGLAKLAQGQEDLTKEQQLVGSASYMAPEQILTGASDPRTDVYALGVMFYLMLSGRKPFNGSNDNVILYKHVNEIPSPLKTMVEERQGIPEALCEVVDQCLMKDPDKRPQTALDLLKAISYALDAPQLSAGFSSMSLARVELQKVSEEAETHFMGSAGAGSISAPVPNVSAELSSVSAAVPASSIAAVVVPPEHTQNYVVGESQSSRDRKALIIMIVIVALVAAIAATAIIVGSGQKSAQQPVAAQADDLSQVLTEIDKLIDAGRFDQALELLESVEANGAKQSDNILLKHKRQRIASGQILEKAREARDQENFDEAQKLYQQVLDQDSHHEVARQELEALKELMVPEGKVQFTYDDTHKGHLTFYVNGEKYEEFPDELAIQPGDYEFQVKRVGYKTWKKSVTIEKDVTLKLALSFEKDEPESDSDPVRLDSGDSKKDDSLIKSSDKNDDDGLLGSGSSSKKKKKSKGSGLLL